MKKRNKLFAIIGSLTLAAALSFGIVGCKDGKGNSGGNAASSKDVYAVSALSGAAYLANTSGVSAFSALAAETATERPAEYTDEAVRDVRNCLSMFDSVISGGGINHTIEKNTETEGEYAEYGFVMTVNAGGQTVKMYYDELFTESGVEIDDEDGTEEYEESTILGGVLVYGEEVFRVDGKREVEKEDGESEFSIEFVTKKDDANFVKVCYESEREDGESEISYEYEIYSNGVKVTETELSIEEENGKTEIKFELEARGAGATEYKIVKKDGSGKFDIKREANGRKSYITAEKTANGYVFTYSNGYTETVDFDDTANGNSGIGAVNVF